MKVPRKSKTRAVTGGTPPVLSKADEDALTNFCTSVALEDVKFDEWKNHHSDLDLQIPLFLRPEEAVAGGEFEVKYSKTIHLKGSAPKRIKACITLTVPPQAISGLQFRVLGGGDEKADLTGNLLITLRIKS